MPSHRKKQAPCFKNPWEKDKFFCNTQTLRATAQRRVKVTQESSKNNTSYNQRGGGLKTEYRGEPFKRLLPIRTTGNGEASLFMSLHLNYRIVGSNRLMGSEKGTALTTPFLKQKNGQSILRKKKRVKLTN